MVFIVRSIRASFRRPYIIVFWSILALIYCFIDYYVYSIFSRFIQLGYGSSIDNIMHLLQMAFNLAADSETFVSVSIYFLLFIFLLSIPSALILSGFLNVVNNAVYGKKRVKGELIQGVKKHFTRIWLVTLVVLLAAVLFTIFILVASVPAMIIFKAVFDGRNELTGAAAFAGALTAFVLFFGSVFLRIHLLFWYPAVIGKGKRPFTSVRKLAGDKFWPLTARLLAFDVIYAFYMMLSMKISSTFILFIVNWLFISLFFSFFAIYIFVLYRQISSEYGGN
jgi:hypothetical protein